MSRRSRSLVPLAAIAALIALAAVPVAAKEGAIAKLDTTIHRDAEPGSTIDVGWSAFMITPTGEEPLYGSPIYIKLVGRDGSSTQADGVETPAGSGHYTAAIVVPASGIDRVIIALVGTACYEDVCERADYSFPLTDDALVSGLPAPVSGLPTPVASVAPVGSGLAPLIVVGVASAVAAGLGALIVARRRRVGVATAGGASSD